MFLSQSEIDNSDYRVERDVEDALERVYPEFVVLDILLDYGVGLGLIDFYLSAFNVPDDNYYETNGVGVRNERQKATLSAFVTGCGCNVGSSNIVSSILRTICKCDVPNRDLRTNFLDDKDFKVTLSLRLKSDAAASVIAEISAFAYAASDETDIDVSFVYVDTNLGFNIRNLICYVTTTVTNG
ncbi:MAG: hypothetical protein EZS28_015149 [Streblomastix strix]|uniref:Uncharacterized protein n=1 Tax=Streblomastix strix TaxID=222440 RepID=A0A5J4W3F6_9EUKA|nr:MAG: hypothetical protein EZS28_015149 [Streblomastix strix]